MISDPDSASLLSDRIKSFWEKEKEVVQNILKKNYEDCHGMSYYESAKERFLGEVEKEIRLLQIDLRTRENNDKEGQVEKKNVLEKIEIPDPKRVLVVYGRNGKARRALFDLLRAVSLDPFEWGEAVKETKKGSPYIGEVLEEAFNKAQAVVILLTGDDVACLREEYINPSDAQHERTLSPQARLNVIFEAGRAFGTHPDRTILVELEKEQTRPFSDIGGRHVVRMSNLPKKRMELVERLKTAGCKISTEGRTDWLDTGDFDGAALSMEPVAEGKKGIKKDVASDVEPISNFLRILEETPELGYSTKTLEIYYHDHRELIRLIKYCIDRSFIRAEPIETDQEGTVDFQGIEITALGKGYLHRQG